MQPLPQSIEAQFISCLHPHRDPKPEPMTDSVKAAFATLTELDLTKEFDLDAKSLENLKLLPNLTSLKLMEDRYNGPVLDNLKYVPHLTNLFISIRASQAKTLENLKHTPELKHLCLWGAGPHLESLKYTPSLETLEISDHGCGYHETIARLQAFLPAFPDLRSLKIANEEVPKEVLKKIRKH